MPRGRAPGSRGPVVGGGTDEAPCWAPTAPGAPGRPHGSLAHAPTLVPASSCGVFSDFGSVSKGLKKENIIIKCRLVFPCDFCVFPFAVLLVFPSSKHMNCHVMAELERRCAASPRPSHTRCLRVPLFRPSASVFKTCVPAVTQRGPFWNSWHDLGGPAADAWPVGCRHLQLHVAGAPWLPSCSSPCRRR